MNLPASGMFHLAVNSLSLKDFPIEIGLIEQKLLQISYYPAMRGNHYICLLGLNYFSQDGCFQIINTHVNFIF